MLLERRVPLPDRPSVLTGVDAVGAWCLPGDYVVVGLVLIGIVTAQGVVRGLCPRAPGPPSKTTGPGVVFPFGRPWGMP